MGYTTDFEGTFKLNKKLDGETHEFFNKLNDTRCHWRPTEDGMGIEFDGSEKFYSYVQWLEYLVDKVLKPRGYAISGVISWCGEDSSDIGAIYVVNNKIDVLVGEIQYKIPKSLKLKY